MLFSFHDDVTEESFVWLHNKAYIIRWIWTMKPKLQNFALSVFFPTCFQQIEWIESDFEWNYKKGLAPIWVTCI